MIEALPDRIRSKIAPDPATGCWLWTGAQSRGYGVVFWSGRSTQAHRVVYHLLTDREFVVHGGRFGTELDHLCRTPPCVRPEHLEPVTRAVNARRARIANDNRSAVFRLIEEYGPLTARELAALGVKASSSRCSHFKQAGRLFVVARRPGRGGHEESLYALTERGREW